MKFSLRGTKTKPGYGTMMRIRDDDRVPPAIFMFIDEQASGYDYEKFAEVQVIRAVEWVVGDHILLDPDTLVAIDE